LSYYNPGRKNFPDKLINSSDKPAKKQWPLGLEIYENYDYFSKMGER
jgi:hypothetical protein